VDDDGELIIRDRAWARLCKEKERELATLVADGTLQGKGKGRGLKVSAGSFYDWLGEEMPVSPGWGFGFDVRPDGEAEEVARRRKERDAAQDAFAGCPRLPPLHFDDWPEFLNYAASFRAKGELDELVDLHISLLREGIEKRWREQRAIEAMVAEAQEAFDGEDPCVPDVRHVIDHTREALVDLHRSLLQYVEPFELPEPDEETLEAVRALYERAQ
jgi:hypothetical protein